MSGTFSVKAYDRSAPLPGIPVTEAGEPVEKTFVMTYNEKAYQDWCHAARVRPGSTRLMRLAWNTRPHSFRGYVNSDAVAEWKWAVFVGMDPRVPSPGGHHSDMAWLESFRRNGYLKRAWFYPHLNIVPDVVPGAAIDDDGREWLSAGRSATCCTAPGSAPSTLPRQPA